MTRGAYGADEVYTRMACESLPEWRALSDRAGLPIFHETGVLFFFPRDRPLSRADVWRSTAGSACRSSCSTGRGAAPSASRRSTSPAVEVGLFEPRFGALMARRAVQTLVAEFVRAGGDVLAGRGSPAQRRAAPAAACRHPTDGERIAADRFVFACGPWLRQAVPRPARPAHLPDPAGGVLLRARGRRHALRSRAGCPAGPISTAATSITAFRTWKGAASRSPTTRTGRGWTRTRGDRALSRAGAGRRARLHGPALPGAGRPAAQRGAGLPI